jgi:phenylalanyl-tRNA synthetase beta chain
VRDSSGAPRYTGITLRGVKIAPSPEWLQKRLISIGLRPIYNIVDIANFVLFELGQPLHTFDADKIKGGTVIVRRAADGETLKTLDGVERKLNGGDMVIANEDGPMCIAGVFGGEDSGVSEDTVNLFIESAYFDPASIRKTSKRLGLQTDASFRYERGADPEVAIYALKRAVTLIQECAGGVVEGKIREVYPEKIERKRIELDYSRMERLIGHEIGHETIEKILTWLCYDFIGKREGGAVVAAPSYMVDVYRECDVVEEVLRIYGYNNIPLPKRMLMSVNATPRPDAEAIRNNISNFLAANGFVETMNNSLTKSEYYSHLTTFPEERCVRIVNPLSQDLNVMRQTLILGGLEVVAYNLNRQLGYLKIFEYGGVYQRLPEKTSETLEGYEEHQCFCLMLTGTPDKSWRVESAQSNYFQLKGYVELLLRRYGADIYKMRCEAAPTDIFSEGMSYSIPGAGQLAVMGTVNPVLARRFGIRQPVYAAEINWPALFELVRRDKVAFAELPKFPEVRRDLALLLDEKVSYADLRAAAFKQEKKLLRHVGLFDVYRGDRIPAGKKQYALSFVIQDPERTLTDQDTERVMDRLLSTFVKDFGAQLR